MPSEIRVGHAGNGRGAWAHCLQQAVRANSQSFQPLGSCYSRRTALELCVGTLWTGTGSDSTSGCVAPRTVRTTPIIADIAVL